MYNFVGALQPERFSELDTLISESIAEERYPEWVYHITVPHQLARDKISYQRTEGAHAPDAVLSELRGDCEDNTALLCSMYAALGLRTAIYTIDSPSSERHCIALVKPPVDSIEYACDLLLLYYHDRLGFEPDAIGIDGTELGEMLVVGSTMTDYVGDIQSLARNGYIEIREADRWVWRDLVDSGVY